MPASVQASPSSPARVVLFQNSHSTPSGKKPNGTDLKIILVSSAGLNTEKQLSYVPEAIEPFRDSFFGRDRNHTVHNRCPYTNLGPGIAK